jgi:hypothetical protein
MDNTVDLPGYKYFVDEAGARPAVKVTFLNLVEADDTVNGVVFPVSRSDLEGLDLRERNYERRAVGDGLWAYFGTGDARARYEEGPSVVSRDYLGLVRSGFEALGELPAFDRTTDPPSVPVRDLRRVDLPSR